MEARGIVFEKRFGSCGERLPHPIRVRLIDGPHADPEGSGFCLLEAAEVGSLVTVEYFPDDQVARVISDDAVTAPSKHRVLDHWSAEDIEGSCPACEAFAVVELTARLKARQPDGTTHVCHPSFGGCNRGFCPDPRDWPLTSRALPSPFVSCRGALRRVAPRLAAAARVFSTTAGRFRTMLNARNCEYLLRCELSSERAVRDCIAWLQTSCGPTPWLALAIA